MHAQLPLNPGQCSTCVADGTGAIHIHGGHINNGQAVQTEHGPHLKVRMTVDYNDRMAAIKAVCCHAQVMKVIADIPYLQQIYNL